jgi:hypothetical protein
MLPIILAALLQLSPVAPAVPAAPPVSAEAPAPVPEPASAAAPAAVPAEEVITTCRYERAIGTRIGRRVCRSETRAARAERLAIQQEIRRAQTPGEPGRSGQ